ncbi:hypothetical protein SASPL_154930 [Salvia splendens]|uniref:Uncharacterized protein n=1 Tax=Salvia splendens TaxID=180675 RepID=A0A8X8W173_SALSN|nr:hypothetical protein SASPL_154930 [Salvia splendens]
MIGAAKAETAFPSVNSKIEKRLKDLEFTQSWKQCKLQNKSMRKDKIPFAQLEGIQASKHQQLSREAQMPQLQPQRGRHGLHSLHERDEERWKGVVCGDVMHHRWRWFDDEISGAVFHIECSMYKDLVNEIVIGEAAASAVRIKPVARRRPFAN